MSLKARIRRLRRRYRHRFASWRQALGRRIDKAEAKRDKRIREIRKKQRDRGRPFRMFDSIEVDEIPHDAPAAAGYVGGSWPTFAELEQSGIWPRDRLLSVAVASRYDADCLDVEPGDATPADAPAWVKRQRARGVKRPAIYASVSTMGAVLAELEKAGIDRDDVKLWTAHYTRTPHLCGPACGFGFDTVADATQFTDKSGGRNLDESLCSAGFLPVE